jgi:hypothetical protein
MEREPAVYESRLEPSSRTEREVRSHQCMAQTMCLAVLNVNMRLPHHTFSIFSNERQCSYDSTGVTLVGLCRSLDRSICATQHDVAFC